MHNGGRNPNPAAPLLRLAGAALLFSGVFSLGGCEAVVVQSSIFDGSTVNLQESSYDAADMLAQQSKGLLKPGTPIRVGILSNAYASTSVKQPALTQGNQPLPLSSTPPAVVTSTQGPSPFGRVIAEQIGGRLVDLGYNIINTGGESRPGQALLTGQYARANGRIFVNLRLVDAETGRILGAYDYSMPVSGEILDLLGTDEHGSGFFDF